MYAAQITQNGNAWYILPMKCEHTRGERSHVHIVPRRYGAVQVVMLPVVCCGDFCKKPCYHLNDVRDRHPTNLVLQSWIICGPPSPGVPSVRQELLRGKTLDMCKISDFDCVSAILLNIIQGSGRSRIGEVGGGRRGGRSRSLI